MLVRMFCVLSRTLKNSGVMGASLLKPLMMATSSGVNWKQRTNAFATVSCMCSLLLENYTRINHKIITKIIN